MSWEEFERPNLSPDVPEPQSTGLPPSRPLVPEMIVAEVDALEQRRGRVVKFSLLLGTVLFGAGISLWAPASDQKATAIELGLLTLGLVIVFPVTALAALVFGPTWQQRQDHWQLLQWEGQYQRWLARHVLQSRETTWQRVERVDQPAAKPE